MRRWGDSPRSQLMDVWRKGLEGSNRLGILISGHRYQMLFAADINSGGVGMNQRQALLLALFIFLRIAFDRFNKWGRRGAARQRNRFTRLSNGVEPP